jgi:hypothetical protein
LSPVPTADPISFQSPPDRDFVEQAADGQTRAAQTPPLSTAWLAGIKTAFRRVFGAPDGLARWAAKLRRRASRVPHLCTLEILRTTSDRHEFSVLSFTTWQSTT